MKTSFRFIYSFNKSLNKTGKNLSNFIFDKNLTFDLWNCDGSRLGDAWLEGQVNVTVGSEGRELFMLQPEGGGRTGPRTFLQQRERAGKSSLTVIFLSSDWSPLQLPQC